MQKRSRVGLLLHCSYLFEIFGVQPEPDERVRGPGAIFTGGSL